MPAARRVLLLLLLLLAILALLFFLAVPSVSFAQGASPAPSTSAGAASSPLADAARQLAAKIAAALPPRATIALEVRNLSSLGAAEVSSARRVLETGLQARGLQFGGSFSDRIPVRVTLSENLDGNLWIAEVARPDASYMAIVGWPKARDNGAPSQTPEVVLKKELIWEQEQQIVDLGFLDPLDVKQQRMLVLEPTRIALYEQTDGQWKFQQSFAISTSKPWPRDLRGQLSLLAVEKPEDRKVWLSLPGTACFLTLRGIVGGSSLECVQSDKPAEENDRLAWLATAGASLVDGGGDFVSSRNFFTGRLYGEAGWRATIEPYFSATVIENLASRATVNAGVDGRVRVYEDLQKPPVLMLSGWGSDLTTLKTACGGSWQILATRPGDWTEPDAVQAYEFHDHQAAALGQPVSLPGPVIALRPVAIPRFGNTGGLSRDAITVVRNLVTGHYEAYELSISCGR